MAGPQSDEWSPWILDDRFLHLLEDGDDRKFADALKHFRFPSLPSGAHCEAPQELRNEDGRWESRKGVRPVKALTVRQPWASLIVAGIKDVENRPRQIRYRGKLAIHAGLKVDDEGMEMYGHSLRVSLPLGAVIGSVDVVDCISDSDSPWALSDCYHWILANPRPLKRPVPATGKLGLWDFQR